MSRRVIYLHGFASSPDSRKAVFFRQRFREKGVELEVPDLAGGDFEHLTITRQLKVIERQARGEAVSLMGSSLGGYLAALYAARHPEVERLVLMAPAFGFANLIQEIAGHSQLAEWERAGSGLVFHYGLGREVPLGWQFVEDAKQYEDFPAVTQPTLIFHGVQDSDVPYKVSEEFVRQHPNARLELVTSGHDLLDAVDRIWTSTVAFLRLRPVRSSVRRPRPWKDCQERG